MESGLSRRGFCSGLVALAAKELFAAVPAISGGNRLAPWKPGEFQIHFIHTGAGESQFLIFPDATTMLLDCPAWQPGLPARTTVPLFPSAKLQAGEWVARRLQAKNHGKESILAKMPEACFKGAHVVITVPPGGKTFRLSQVDAGSEDGLVLNEMEIGS